MIYLFDEICSLNYAYLLLVQTMQQQDPHNVTVTWRGEKFILEMDSSATLKELGVKLQKLTDVKEDTIRLIVPSNKTPKLLSPFTEEQSSLSLQETSIFEVSYFPL